MAAPRLHSLDLARGAAALVVIIYHWQPMDRFGPLPLHQILWPLYKYGWLAVDLFFVVSGFIMFHLYRRRIAGREVSAAQFAWLRFTRLYPLHILTLLLTAAVYMLSPPSLFLHKNTPQTFLLNLAFLQGLWPASWNHPSWSLTVEAIAYCLFFVVARRNVSALSTGAICLLGFALLPVHENLSRGIVGFFAGGVIYFCYEKVSALKFAALAAAALALSGGLYATGHERLGITVLQLGFFPPVVGALAQLELGMSLAWIGTLSYSIYMIHVPMQLLLAAVATRFHLQISWALGPFLLLVIGMGAISYFFIERTAQHALRRVKIPPHRQSVPA